jgi:GH24 family phage-related lysozyme (muramidase)
MTPLDYFDDLSAHEGCTTWLYCDVRGFVTIGIGNMLPDEESCGELPFYFGTNPPPPALPVTVTNLDKRAAWVRVRRAFDRTKSAAYYRQFSALRLTEDFVRLLACQRLEREFLPGIARLCPQFATFPLSARRALVDMAYNLGCAGLGMFPHMLAACNAGDWEMAANQCHRSTCRESRNAWTAQMFIDADATKGPTT